MPLRPMLPYLQRSNNCARAIILLLVICFTRVGLGQLPGASSEIEKPLVPNNRWAIIIGVSDYLPEIGPLKYTSKEAREVAAKLKGSLQFNAENVKLLANGGTPEEAPSSANILASLDQLLNNRRLDKANLFVFYFSGHGIGTSKGDFLLPADIRKDNVEQMGLPVREVVSRIVKAGLKNVLIVADACRAGTKNEFGVELSALCHKANIAVLLGCAPGKRSYEYPALGQGAFTHFLLEGLTNPTLRDSSGALWAFKLGQDVQRKVHDYTEVDHGKFAQVPALWGDSTTLDVLLAAYPKPPITDLMVNAFKTKASRMSKEEFGAAATSYANSLYVEDRQDEAVELLKTVDQLGELTPSAGVTLATALNTLGRTGEAERVFAKLQDGPNGYWKDFAIAASLSREVDPAARVESAIRLFESGDDWDTKWMAYTVLDKWAAYDQRLKFAQKIGSLKGATRRQQLFGAAQVASLKGQWLESLKSLDLANVAPGNSPSGYLIYMTKLEPLLSLGNPTMVDAYLQEGAKFKGTSGFAFIERAQLAKNKGDLNGRLTNLKSALKQDLDPRFILLAARVAGPYLGSLQEEFKSAALKHPYSWRARIVLYFIRKIQNDPLLETDGAAVDRYIDDPLTFNSQLFSFMDSYMAEAVQLDRLKLETYREQLDFYFLVMKDSVSKFGFAPDLWMQLTKYGLYGQRNAQVNQLVAKNLPLSPESAPKSMRPMLALLAMNRGDSDTEEKLFKSAFEPADRRDIAWRHASYLATRGDTQGARMLIKNSASPSPELAIRMRGLQTYLLVKAGKSEEAKRRLQTPADDVIEKAWNGLTYAEMGAWDKAEPLLIEQLQDRDWEFLFVQEFAIRCLDSHLRRQGRLDDAIAVGFSAMSTQPGNPLFARYVMAEKEGVAQFTGTIEMNAVAIDDKEPNLQGVLHFTVSPTGSFEGAFTPANSSPIALTGVCDAMGNLVGSCTWNGRSCSIAAKLAPAKLYQSYPRFKDVGQYLQLVDQDSFRIAILAKSSS